MTVWVLHQNLSPKEEASIHERTQVLLPFDDMPNLALISSPTHYYRLLQEQYPDQPPETLMLKFDRLWQQFNSIAVDDIVVVPLTSSQSVVLGKVTGRYHYHEGEHRLPVEWYPGSYAMNSFGQLKYLFSNTGNRMAEVIDRDARIKILDRLPHRYNRFARWKWIIVIFFALQMISMAMQLLK